MINKFAEIYKCLVLTIIAIFLILIFLKIPNPSTPVTLKNLIDKKVSPADVPVVKIFGN